jgi:predicted transcriptional regulator
MHDQPSVERAVLGLVLDAHPKSLTIPEVARQIDRGDATERAIRNLVGVGLLECSGITIRPSAAALHFERLELP